MRHRATATFALTLALALPGLCAAAPVATPKVGLSGKTLAVVFSRADGSPSYGNAATLAGPAVATPPALTLNGTPVAVGAPISYADYLLYPLPVTVAAGDTLAVTAGASWASTADGAAPALSAVAAPPASFLPAFDATTKTMRLGWNCPAAVANVPLPLYANLFRHAGWFVGYHTTAAFDPDSNPTSVASTDGPTSNCALSAQFAAAAEPSGYQVPGSGVNAGYPNTRDGTYTLLWDGSSASVVMQTGDGITAVTQTAQNITNGANNSRTYAVTGVGTQFWRGLQVTLAQLPGPCDVRNIRVYGPGTATDGSQTWHPDVLSKFRGAAVIRFMDAFASESSNVVNYSDWTAPTAALRAGTKSLATFSLTQAAPYANADNAFPASIFGGSARVLFTTAAPHGLSEGQTVNLPSSPSLASLVYTDGVNGRASGFMGQVHVVSPTTFAVALYSQGAALASAQAVTAAGTVEVVNRVPVAEAMDLCGTVGADAWINIPHAATDACVAAMAADVFAHLPPGRKAFVEYSNETWNYNVAYQQALYAESQAGILGLDSGAKFHCHRFKRCMDLFAAAASNAGRPGDLVRVLGSWWGGLGRTQEMVPYLLAIGGACDRLAIAPYYDGTPPTTPDGGDRTPVFSGMSADQHEDAEELHLTRNPNYTGLPAAHRAALQASFPAAKLACYEWSIEKPVTAGTNYDSKSRALTRRPRVANLQLRLCQMLQDQGCAESTLYSLGWPVGSDGAAYALNWGAYYGAATVAGVGDGSDGLYDNRVNPEDLTRIVSVPGYAFNRWASLVGAPPPPPPPGGGSNVKTRRTGGGRAGSRGPDE